MIVYEKNSFLKGYVAAIQAQIIKDGVISGQSASK